MIILEVSGIAWVFAEYGRQAGRLIRIDRADIILVLVTESGASSVVRRYDLVSCAFLQELDGLTEDAVSFDVGLLGDIVLLAGSGGTARVERRDGTTAAVIDNAVEPGAILDNTPTFLQHLAGGEPVPAISQWGAFLMVLSILTAAMVVLRKVGQH